MMPLVWLRCEMKIQLIVAWYDIWVGVFIDRKNRSVYVFPIPCVGVRISWNPPKIYTLQRRRYGDQRNMFEWENVGRASTHDGAYEYVEFVEKDRMERGGSEMRILNQKTGECAYFALSKSSANTRS